MQPADVSLTREVFEARLPSDELWQEGKDAHEDLPSLDERSEHPESFSLPKDDHENDQTQDQKASMEVIEPEPTNSKTVRSFIDIALRISPSSAQLLSSLRTKVLAALPDLEAQSISKVPLLNQISSSLNNISHYRDSLAIYARHHAAFPFTIG
ncbi:hypothetical protein DL95DRAFT_493331 [Leptodontidium sp. 2 PMI_412]|nr:hypothetical protein DL95DRAFT_493331 [Leptodontidium sp. 2 PMI_412]